MNLKQLHEEEDEDDKFLHQKLTDLTHKQEFADLKLIAAKFKSRNPGTHRAVVGIDEDGNPGIQVSLVHRFTVYIVDGKPQAGHGLSVLDEDKVLKLSDHEKIAADLEREMKNYIEDFGGDNANDDDLTPV